MDSLEELLTILEVEDLLKYFDRNRIEKLRTHGSSMVVTDPKTWLRNLGCAVG